MPSQEQDTPRYRKLYPRLWKNQEFLDLSRDDRLVVLYLLTGPQTNRLGYFAFSPGEAAEDLGFPVGRAFITRLRRICGAFDWAYDDRARVLLLSSWWAWNRPENPNVLTGALKDLAEVPVSSLDERFSRMTLPLVTRFGVNVPPAYVSRVYASAPEGSPQRSPQPSPEPPDEPSPERCRDGSGNQEQEQEQEQEPKAVSARAPGKPLSYRPRVDVAWPGRPPVPGGLHAEFIDKLGGDPAEAEARLRAWYPQAAAAFEGLPIGDDDWRFWRLRFREWLGTTASAATRVASPMPVYGDVDWCQHEPRCNSRDWHDVLLEREARPLEQPA